jgi:hypothetical protein
MNHYRLGHLAGPTVPPRRAGSRLSARRASHPPQPSRFWIGGQYYLTGTVHQLLSRNDEAITWYEKARTAWPAVPEVRSRLASVYALQR